MHNKIVAESFLAQSLQITHIHQGLKLMITLLLLRLLKFSLIPREIKERKNSTSCLLSVVKYRPCAFRLSPVSATAYSCATLYPPYYALAPLYPVLSIEYPCNTQWILYLHSLLHNPCSFHSISLWSPVFCTSTAYNLYPLHPLCSPQHSLQTAVNPVKSKHFPTPLYPLHHKLAPLHQLCFHTLHNIPLPPAHPSVPCTT